MDQQKLRELEYRCIQEEAPECTAACPIHVNGRAFVGHIAAGDWIAAWKVLRKTMPFAGILGRICDAPCRLRCKRKEAGDPIEIGDLERACVATPPPVDRIQPLPPTGKTIAVLGSGISGLTAAWDLALKGYSIRIFEPGSKLGGPLRAIPAGRLPQEVLDEELSRLTALDVEVCLEVDVEPAAFLEGCLAENDAVYIGLDAVESPNWNLKQDDTGRILSDPFVRSTSRPAVFAGGRSDPAAASTVMQAAEGRWAAASIDRFLQQVSLTAGREKDGPYPTRLFTSLEGVEPLPRVAAADRQSGYAPGEAIAEAGRCLQCECLECVKVCAYLERFGAYPRKYAREIYNNESIVMGTHQANKLANSCSLCGLCERVCPEDFAMQDLCLQARQSMVRRGKMPPSAHDFALRDLQFSRSDRFRLARHAPGRMESGRIFFPGCNLCASSPGSVQSVYMHLVESLPDGVGLMLGCCGAPAFWAGEQDVFNAVRDEFLRDWSSLGKPEIIAACSTCFSILTEHLPQIPVTSLWQLLEQTGLPKPPGGPLEFRGAIHDPCTTRPYSDIQDAVRGILKRMGYGGEELTLSRDKTECCGYGGLMQNANPDLAREVATRRAQISPEDYLTYCAMCRDSLAAVGKRALHLLDLVFPDAAQPDPASRRRPGWSKRMENRYRLRQTMLIKFWGEEQTAMQPYSSIRLIIPADVQEVLEKRRILNEDLQQIIYEAERSGGSLVHPESGRQKACLRSFMATVWVDYSPTPEGYLIHNAYSHRMTVTGGRRRT